MSVRASAATFRALHDDGCFLMPNPWDVGSARFLQGLGFQALATTSAGLAFSRGRPDTMTALSVEEVLAHTRELVEAVSVPVNVDFQDGYARDPEGVVAHVSGCVAAGAAGLSMEDATGDPSAPLYERAHAIDRVRAARRAIDASGLPVVLTARCEAWLVGHPQAERVVLDRLVAYAEAGADCLYAPGVHDAGQISRIVRAVAPRAVNVLMSTTVPGLGMEQLAELGVRRVSLGSALARVAWGAFMHAARDIAKTGTFGSLAGAASFAEVNGVFRGW
jgi:2-methylisocitrate lyase-like PEP mutase family enzyme